MFVALLLFLADPKGLTFLVRHACRSAQLVYHVLSGCRGTAADGLVAG